MAERTTAEEHERRAARSPWPPALLLALFVGGALFLALREAKAVSDKEGTRRKAIARTLLRDPLTGRLLRSDGTPEPPGTGWGSADQPLRLRFVPSGDREQAGATIDHMVAWLRRRTGYAIEGAILKSYGLVVQEIAQGRCDVGFLTAASYARAWYATAGNDDPKDDIDAFLSAVRDGDAEHPGSDLAYRGAIITHADAPLESVEDLTDEHVVAMGNRTSGASSILPTALFASMGISPRIHRIEGYPLIVTAVLQRSVDAGAVFWSTPTEARPQNDGRITALQMHPDVFERTKIIGYTAWIPNEPVVIREAVPEEIRHVLARAIPLYVAGLVTTAEGRRRLESIGSVVAYLPATDEDYAPLLEVIERAFADDPEGRRDFTAIHK